MSKHGADYNEGRSYSEGFADGRKYEREQMAATPEVEEIKINWKAIASQKLLDSGISPRTTAELIVTLDGLLQHVLTTLTTKHQEELEKAVEAERERCIATVRQSRTVDEHLGVSVHCETARQQAIADLLTTPTKTDETTELC